MDAEAGQTASPIQPTGGQPLRFVLYPGLEFDPTRKYRYGLHALTSAGLLFVAFILVELRDCNGGPFIDLDKLQALHVSMLIFTFVLYLLSLFGIADFVFQFKLLFFAGLLIIYTSIALMIWMTYEAAVNTCVKTFNFPVDLTFDPNKNVFSNGDAIGIIVLLLDIFATVLTFSAAGSFYKRY